MAQRPQRENIVRQLTKLGDTVFQCEEVDIPEDFNYFIPNSVLSEMRRQLVVILRKVESGQRKENTQVADLKENTHFPLNSFLSNIANQVARDFYGAKEISAYELKGGSGPIMQCRHCIRYSLGFCVRHGGERPQWQEPLSLVLGDGRRFRLEFDCQHCQMNVFGGVRRSEK